MGRRLKTKTSPTSWRLDEDALKALTILEAQEPQKDRGQIIGEQLIAAATQKEPPPSIRFNEIDPKEMLNIRAELAELVHSVRGLRAALKPVGTRDKEEREKLSAAIKEAGQLIERFTKVGETIRELAKNSAQVEAHELKIFAPVYKGSANNHRSAVSKIGTEPQAQEKAEHWETFGNFCLLFCPDLGPKLKTPTQAPPTNSTSK